MALTGDVYRCYAKVNLTLEIVRRRDDGFHEIASLVHTIGLADDLHLGPASTLLSRVEGLSIEPSANLVTRAAALLERTARRSFGAEITLIKRIPAAAGLGGGSSDAAATLIGLNQLWGLDLTVSELADLAAELGSDVPFFLRGGAALMTGRGEILEPLPPQPGQWLILVVPEHDVADKTRRLYAALTPDDFSSGDITRRAVAALHTGRIVEDDLMNGFSRAARASFPHLATTWSAVEQRCGRRFHLSGAGPALFGLASGRADALQQARLLSEDGIPAQAVRTVKHARVSASRR